MEGENIIIRSSSSSEELVHSISILLVDDDLTCLSNVANKLKKFKCEVVTARHQQDALNTLRLKRGAFDLVVSDVHMPDMDGFDLTKAIAQEFDLPVILMSADVQDDVVSKGLDNGVAFFITKPISTDDLRYIRRFACTNKKRQITVREEIRGLPEPETSPERIIIDEITISDSSVEEDIDVEKDLKEKALAKRVSNENREASASSSSKKPKLIWTNSLHNRFLQAIRKIGLDKAVPKKILEVMNVPGLTRENVASHLQKYRLFLRRVSDSSFEIPYGSGESLTRRFITSSRSNSSTLILNKISKSRHHHPWRFPNSNLSASSSSILTGSTYARILANKGNFCGPNVASSNLLIHDIDRSCVRSGENSIHTRPQVENNFSTTSLENLPMYGLSAYYTTWSTGGNIGTSSNVVSTEPAKSFTHQNYVGYRISNLQRLAESGLFQNNQGGVQSNSGPMDSPNAEIHNNNLSLEANSLDEHSSFDDLLDQLLADSSSTPSAPNNNDEKQLSDVIADYQKLISKANISLQNGDEYNSLIDLDEFDIIMSTEQSLNGVELYHTTLPDPASFENHQQAPHQDHQCQVPQEFIATHQFGETHRSLDDQQDTTNSDLANPLDFIASSQLDNISLSPIQVEDEEFLESLFFNFPWENQTLDGI